MKLVVGNTPRGNLALITQDNHLTEFDVGYTGIKEFQDKTQFFDLCLRADEIEYHPYPASSYNVNDITSTGAGYEQFLVAAAGAQKSTRPVMPPSPLYNKMANLVDHRHPVDWPQLWAAGCSVTIGVGVEPEARWGEIVAHNRNMHVSWLAYGGTSNQWAADQILRSDIRQGDIVVWALTNNERWAVFRAPNKTLLGNPGNYATDEELRQLMPPSMLFDETVHWANNTVQAVLQVQNFCNKVGTELFVIGGILSNNEILLYLYDNPVYYHFYNPELVFTVDRGTDGQHPGPVQHQRYADFILAQIQKRLTR